MIEMQKKGKMPAEMRYKLIFKRKQEQARAKALASMSSKDAVGSGNMVTGRKMSEKAEQALKEVAMKKAAKEQKKLRKMVIVQPQNFTNGHIDKKGQIFDIAGNMIGRVNTKNGTIALNSGWTVGKYKPKSFMTRLLIEEAINKHSPYFVRQRLLAAQQAALSNVHGSYADPNVLNVHGMSAQAAMLGGGMYGGAGHHDFGVHGPDENHLGGLGSNISITAWGAMSNNAWGTYSNNVHGTLADNVHGTMNTDVWGSVANNGLWGVKSVRLYGTGGGVNHLTGITKWILGIFGYQSKAAREGLRQQRALSAAAANSARPTSAPRGGGRR